MASIMVFSVFRVSITHPYILTKYGEYTLKQLVSDQNIFEDQFALSQSELMLSCKNISLILIDYGESIRALPLLTLMDYIATELLLLYLIFFFIK